MPLQLRELSRGKQVHPRAIVESLVIIILVALAGLAATSALFFDRETSNQAVFQVGTLDLDLINDNNQERDSLSIENVGADGVVSGSKSWRVRNVGTLPGILEFEVLNLKNFENDCTGPERLVDETCENPGERQGELGSVLDVVVLLSDDEGTREIITTTLDTANEALFKTQWASALSEYQLPPGQQVELELRWQVSPAGYSNSIQSDSITFDIVATLRQIL